jgi:hypothetical protein
MKKIFTLLFLLPFISNAQLMLVEDFTYTAGQLTAANSGANVSGGVWTTNSGTSNYIPVIATSLTYAGYAGSGVGGAISLASTGEDAYRDITGTPQNSGSVYASFLINVSAAQATGDYFFALLPSADASNYAGRTYIKSSGAGFVMGISKYNDAATYGTTVLNFNQTYLVVVKYTFLPVTTTDDQVALYVFDSGIPATEPAVPYAGPTVSTLADRVSIGRVAVRQGNASNAATLTFDAIRVATAWYNAPLPVNLLSFSATLNDKNVNLNWFTANEVNAASFDIQRSVNGKDFKSFATVEAKNGTATNNYSFVDVNPVAGVSYYRLKMNDKDGSFKYSAIEIVKTKTIGVSVYPNPVRSSITVQHEVAAKGAVIAVMDMSGKQASSVMVQVGAVQTTINAAQLAPGSYMVVYTNNGTRVTKQFIKE